MKRFLQLTAVIILLSACGSSKNSFSTSEDKQLIDVVKKLKKNPDKVELRETLVQLYNTAAKVHLDNIEVYRTLTDVDRWDKIIGEYQALQKLHDVIYSSNLPSSVLSIKNYSAEIIAAKQEGAAAYYQRGIDLLNEDSRESAKDAYYSFKKANQLVSGFKDATRQMDKAFEQSIVNVVINPIRENFYYSNLGNRMNSRFSRNQDYFQSNLVRDLGGSYNNRSIPARFYTDYELRRNRVTPDWEVDLEWVNLDVPQPFSRTYTRNLSRQVQVGTDTSGKPVYRTASATLYITENRYRAQGDLQLKITDIATGNSIAYNRFTENYDWTEEYASYTGDQQALSSYDWNLINGNRNSRYNNNNGFGNGLNGRGGDDMIDQLYQQVYTRVKNRIYSAVAW
jgi:hypothetical protein